VHRNLGNLLGTARQVALMALLGLSGTIAAAQPPVADAVSVNRAEAPLPEVASFAAEVKARLRTDRALQANYTFLERRQEIEVSKFGKVAVGSTKTYEVYPSLEPGNTYKRLVAVDGNAVSAAELEKGDTKHRQDLEDQESSPEKRAKHDRDVAEDRRREHEDIDEIFRVYEMRIVGRQDLNGYQTIVGELEPRASYRPKSEDGQLMKRFRARVWINEADYQLARVDLEAIDDVTYGWGIVARLHKGAKISYERRKVNDEVWLPQRLRIVGTGRSILFRSFSIDSTTEWSQYKKFAVKTDETYSH
jgi:hypothetical protein